MALRTKKILTTMTLAGAPLVGSAAASGATVTFTATVTAATEASTHPVTGTVTFYDAGSVIGTGQISSGVATFATSGLSVAKHQINATYDGDSFHKSSTSNTLGIWIYADLQLDAATVTILNGYLAFLGSSATLSGLMRYQGSGAAWFEAQSDNPIFGIAINRFAFPVLNFVIVQTTFQHLSIQMTGSSTLFANTQDPTGVWTITGYSPAGFAPTNPPSWPPPSSVSVAWA